MARPPKSIDQTVGHRTKAEIETRKQAEEKIKGADDLVFKTPNWLSKEAKKIYKFLIEQFKQTGILTNLDKETVAICADTIAKMREAQRLIDEQGLMVDGKANPMINVYEKYSKIYAKMITELGLSPTARSRMALTQVKAQEQEGDPILKIINGGKMND